MNGELQPYREKLKSTRILSVKEKKEALVILRRKRWFEDKRGQIVAKKSNIDQLSFNRIKSSKINAKMPSIPTKDLADDKCEITQNYSKKFIPPIDTEERSIPIRNDKDVNQIEVQANKLEQIKTHTKILSDDNCEIIQNNSKKVISTIGTEDRSTPIRNDEDLQMKQEKNDEEENHFEDQAIKKEQMKCLLCLRCFW